MTQNDTTTVLTQGEGDQRRDATLPTTILTSNDAAVLCHYRAFLDAYELRESIYCDECAGPPDAGAKIARGDNQVAVFCPHRVWFYQGMLAGALESRPDGGAHHCRRTAGTHHAHRRGSTVAAWGARQSCSASTSASRAGTAGKKPSTAEPAGRTAGRKGSARS